MRYAVAVRALLTCFYFLCIMLMPCIPLTAADTNDEQKPKKEQKKQSKKKDTAHEEQKPAEDNDIKYQEWLRQQEINKAAKEKSKKEPVTAKKDTQKKSAAQTEQKGENGKKKEKDVLTKMPEKSELQKQMDAEEARLRAEDAKKKAAVKKSGESSEDEMVPVIAEKKEPTEKQQPAGDKKKDSAAGKKVAKKEVELKKVKVLMPEKCVPETQRDQVKVIPVTEVFFKLRDKNSVWIPIGSAHGIKKGDKFYVCRDVGQQHYYPVTEVEVSDVWIDAVTARPLAQFDHDKAESYGMREGDVIIFREEEQIVKPEKKKSGGIMAKKGKKGMPKTGDKRNAEKKGDKEASVENEAAPCRVVDTKDGYNRNMLPEMKEDLLRFVPPKGDEKKKETDTNIEIQKKKPAEPAAHSSRRDAEPGKAAVAGG